MSTITETGWVISIQFPDMKPQTRYLTEFGAMHPDLTGYNATVPGPGMRSQKLMMFQTTEAAMNYARNDMRISFRGYRVRRMRRLITQEFMAK